MPHTSAGGPKKRWAPRVRTGCLTCRARRVKCDETQPVCKKCLHGRRSCQYGLRWQSLGQVAQDMEALTALVPPSETAPPQWDFMQAVRYYYVVAWPTVQATLVKKIKPLTFNSTERMFPGTFVCRVICDAIAAASRSRGRLLRLGEEPAFSGLWQNHSRYLLEHIKHLNGAIGKGDVRAAFYDLDAILDFDIIVDGFMWQTHMNGCFAYVECCGGIDTFTDETIIRSISAILNRCIRCNTTTPAQRQVLGYYRYTDQQIKAMLDDFQCITMPCPTELHILIVQITRLRVDVANHANLPDYTMSKTQTILHRIDDFDVDAWTEKSTFSRNDLARYYAEIFQLAVKLYGILSLPGSAVRAVYPDTVGADGMRTTLRQRLVQLFREVRPTVEDMASLQWPFVVAGVAAAAGTDAVEDREFIAQCLHDIWRRPLSDASTYKCLQKLRAFWLSGQTAWEDCFYEPTPC